MPLAIIDLAACKVATRSRPTGPPTFGKLNDYYLQASDCFTAFNITFSVKDLYETRRLVQESLASLIEIERAIALNPNYMDWQLYSCETFAACGRSPWGANAARSFLPPVAGICPLYAQGVCASVAGPYATASREHPICAQAISSWL
jgi:hypothetical protein